MKFEDLKLNHGYPLQIQVPESARRSERWPCRLIGAIAGRTLLLSVPRVKGKVLRFLPGQKIYVRMMVATGVGAFVSHVESQAAEPYPILFVSYPKDVTFKGVRSATRVGVDQPVFATNVSSLNQESVSGRLADVSITGARLEVDDVLGEMGDKIHLNARVDIAGIERDLLVEAVLRSRVKRSTQEKEQKMPVVYGIEFTEPDDERRLLLCTYVFCQIAHDQLPTP